MGRKRPAWADAARRKAIERRRRAGCRSSTAEFSKSSPLAEARGSQAGKRIRIEPRPTRAVLTRVPNQLGLSFSSAKGERIGGKGGGDNRDSGLCHFWVAKKGRHL